MELLEEAVRGWTLQMGSGIHFYSFYYSLGAGFNQCSGPGSCFASPLHSSSGFTCSGFTGSGRFCSSGLGRGAGRTHCEQWFGVWHGPGGGIVVGRA